MIVGEKMVSAVIVAAGKGSRMKLSYNKMFIKLEEKAILLHTIEKFQGLVDEIIVVCHKDEMNDVKKLVSNDIVLVSGGDTRMESVYNGLQKARYNETFLMGEEDKGATTMVDNNDDYDEPLYNEIVEFVVREQKASASLLQRRFRLGYNRAARCIDLLEERGIIGPNNGSKPREVLVKLDDNKED